MARSLARNSLRAALGICESADARRHSLRDYRQRRHRCSRKLSNVADGFLQHRVTHEAVAQTHRAGVLRQQPARMTGESAQQSERRGRSANALPRRRRSAFASPSSNSPTRTRKGLERIDAPTSLRSPRRRSSPAVTDLCHWPLSYRRRSSSLAVRIERRCVADQRLRADVVSREPLTAEQSEFSSTLGVPIRSR